MHEDSLNELKETPQDLHYAQPNELMFITKYYPFIRFCCPMYRLFRVLSFKLSKP